MTDHIIKAAKEAGMTTGDNQKHNGVYWWRSLGRPTNVSTTDLERFYAIAYRAGMERAAEICDNWMAPPYVGSVDNANLYHSATNDCADEIRRHAQNQPKTTHDGSVV